MRITGSIEMVLRHGDDRKSSFDAVQTVHDTFYDSRFTASTDKIDDNFCIHCSLERNAVFIELCSQLPCVRQITIMG